ncbi:MAG: PHP domain-containing protein, partial [Candidatus Moranbacteria bacterium]|nr:PHP domain-containing protein [Candidatus Moranbacteria bacterium]
MSETTTLKFTHLHVHTHYSLLDGLAKVDKILDHAKELGMDSLAITDHGVLYGAIEFYIKAKERGIKPIIGCEFYVTSNDLHSKNPTAEDKKRYHLILLAKNEKGYKNLMRLITIAHLEGFYYKPRIDRQTLRKYSEGLIGLSACTQGEVPDQIIAGNMERAEELALEYQDIFGKGDFYLEIQHHPKFPNQAIANKGLIELSKKLGIKLVATNDIHYIKKEDAEIQDILLCIQTILKVDEKDRMYFMDFELYLKSTEDIAADFAHVPEGFTAQTYLEKMCEDGLQKRFDGDITSEHR